MVPILLCGLIQRDSRLGGAQLSYWIGRSSQRVSQGIPPKKGRRDE